MLEETPIEYRDALQYDHGSARATRQPGLVPYQLKAGEETARTEPGSRAKPSMTLGLLSARKQDLPATEVAFREAVAREPESVEPPPVVRFSWANLVAIAALAAPIPPTPSNATPSPKLSYRSSARTFLASSLPAKLEDEFTAEVKAARAPSLSPTFSAASPRW